MPKKSDDHVSYDRLLEQERLILRVTELIAEQLEQSGVRKIDLAERLGTSKAYITQALGGGRNLTLRTVADLAWALNRQVHVAMPPGDGVEISRSTLKLVPTRLQYEFKADPPALEPTDQPPPERVQPLVA